MKSNLKTRTELIQSYKEHLQTEEELHNQYASLHKKWESNWENGIEDSTLGKEIDSIYAMYETEKVIVNSIARLIVEYLIDSDIENNRGKEEENESTNNS